MMRTLRSLIVALAMIPGLAVAQTRTSATYVVQFAHSSSATTVQARAAALERAGVRETRILEAGSKKRHLYRVVSRSFKSYQEARLALTEARKILRPHRVSFDGLARAR